MLDRGNILPIPDVESLPFYPSILTLVLCLGVTYWGEGGGYVTVPRDLEFCTNVRHPCYISPNEMNILDRFRHVVEMNILDRFRQAVASASLRQEPLPKTKPISH